MFSPLRLAWTLVVLAFLSVLATAEVNSQCVVHGHGIYNQVVTPSYVAPVLTQVEYPSYGTTYDASATEIPKLKESLAAQQARIAVLETARDNLAARLAVLEAKVGVTPPAAPATPSGASQAPLQPSAKPTAKPIAQGALPALYARSCIACHQQGRKTAGGLALVDAQGKEIVQGCETRLEILRRANLVETEQEAMPPKAPNKQLTEAEKKVYERPSDEEAADLLEKLTRSAGK